MNKRRLGGYYEDAAGNYLVKNGLTILDKNVRCGRLGEIDLIGIDTTAISGDTLVFAEIKYRSGDRFGQGVYAVDATKQKTIRRCAEYYLKSHSFDGFIRFDVVSIDDGTVTWIRDAF